MTMVKYEIRLSPHDYMSTGRPQERSSVRSEPSGDAQAVGERLTRVGASHSVRHKLQSCGKVAEMTRWPGWNMPPSTRGAYRSGHSTIFTRPRQPLRLRRRSAAIQREVVANVREAGAVSDTGSGYTGEGRI